MDRRCATCDEALTKRNQQTFCSILCANARKNGPRASRTKRACEVCGIGYVSTYEQQRTCGRWCGYYLQRGRWPSSKVEQSRPLVRTCCPIPEHHPARWFGDSWPVEYRQCGWCDKDLGPQSPRNHRALTYCSDYCNIRMKRARRQSRQQGTPERQTWTWGAFMRMAAKFNWCCAYCGDKPERLDPDHVIPLAHGGSNALSNLLPTCMPCNSDKRDLSLAEWHADRARRGLPSRTTSWAVDDHRFTHLAVSTPLGRLA